MEQSIEELMAGLGISGLDEEPKKEEPQETTPAEKEEVTPADVVEELLVEVKDEPLPEPAKKRRGRPPKAKSEEPPKEEKVEAKSEVEITPVPEVTSEEPTNESEVESVDAVEATNNDNILSEEKDIYILQDTQIINGEIYRRGQKITFRKGDKFYLSQTDRNGNNWLDYVDDPEAQYAYFGKLIVEADNWTGIPIGSIEGINHPGLALAISEFAKKEYERNGKPLN